MRMRAGRATAVGIAAGLPVGAGAVVVASYVALADVPMVPVPAQNPITESKRVLGKILFFEEQLSTSNTVSCATCHVMNRAGADNRLGRHPGLDGVLFTPDDKVASPGVISSIITRDFVRDPSFGLVPQVTDRSANPVINAAFSPTLFWDGRAEGPLVDPLSGQTVIPAGGALEIQALQPLINSVEMAHAGVVWDDVTEKLARVRPLELATNLPADVGAALAAQPGYAALFQQAFGTPEITPTRIAMAIATYQRTLISDQTPWDAFQAGQTGALTQGQIAGMQIFEQNCGVCHDVQDGLFTDHTFRNIGLRPIAEDRGRQNVTSNANHRGQFRVPGLRNVGLKQTFMHNGQFTTLQEVVRFYVRAPGAAPQFPDNMDPAMLNINFPPQAEPALIDFLSNALRDARVQNEVFPFDRATLYSNRPAQRPQVVGGGIAGTGGAIPQIFAPDPPMVGNIEFRVGMEGALPGAAATLIVSLVPPSGGVIPAQFTAGSVTVGAGGNTQGLATLHWPLRPGTVTGGQNVWVQWVVQDAGAPGGQARSTVARLPVFCGVYGCPTFCYANCDGSTSSPALNVADFGCFLQRFAAGDPYANCDGSTSTPALNVADFGCFLQKFAAGCP